MMPAQADGTTRHEDRDAELAQRAARRIGEYLTMHPGADPVTIQGELAGDDALIVPREAAVLLAQTLGYLANGEGVNVMPDSAELTTQQAAEFLNVSRPYLIKLLEAEQIPFRRVGTHRRIRFRDLRLYQSRDDLKRRQAADELTELSRNWGCTDSMTFTVLYDANVLYPNTLRDLLIRIAQWGTVQAKWTNAILDEMIAALRRNRPDIAAEKIQRLRELMNRAVRDCLVSGYEPLVEGLKLPDPNDRHVLAAAIKAGAQVIVTRNLRDLPAADLEPWNIEAKSPDAFVLDQVHISLQAVAASIRQIADSRTNPPEAVEDVLSQLERDGLVESIVALRAA